MRRGFFNGLLLILATIIGYAVASRRIEENRDFR